jgi:hypothetical protein
MATTVSCPNCGNTVDVESVLANDIENRVKQQYQEKLRKNLEGLEDDRKQLAAEQAEFLEKKKKENELFAQRMQQEKIRMEQELQLQLRQSIEADFQQQVQLLQQQAIEKEDKLKQARERELQFLQKEKQLADKEAELEITLQKKLQEERQQLTEQIRQQETQRTSVLQGDYELKLKELQLQLDEQKKLADEMKRRAEQSSMQRQGEAQELILEDRLREWFPYDVIEEVGKGVEGADCIQQVRTSTGQLCGKIIYESKRTKGWNNSWIDKLKSDKRQQHADVAILVTQTFPKDMERFGEKDGVWICSFAELDGVVTLLRASVIRVFEAQQSQENKGDKMHMLYDYLTGNEFRGQMEAIVEGFLAVRQGIMKERLQMEKIWKEREKQLEKVLLHTTGFYGSIKGIAGASVGNIPLLDGTDEEPDLLAE